MAVVSQAGFLGIYPRYSGKASDVLKTPFRYRVEVNLHLADKSFAAGQLPHGVAARYIPDPDKSRPELPVFVMAHGMGLSFAHFDELAATLAESGVESLLVALPGHFGDTKTVRAEIYNSYDLEYYRDRVIETIKSALEIYSAEGRAVAALGHSMGALLTLMALSSTGEDREILKQVGKVVLLSGVGTASFPTEITRAFLIETISHGGELLANSPWTFGDIKGHLYNNMLQPGAFATAMLTSQEESCTAIWQMLGGAIPGFVQHWPISRLCFDPFIMLEEGTRVLNLGYQGDVLISGRTTRRMGDYLQRIGGGRVTTSIIPGACHNGMMTHPASTAMEIIKWLEGSQA
ncbi:MAG: alpha/beta fold hydrolase [Candidatus Margulisiibacteriota bacterium]